MRTLFAFAVVAWGPSFNVPALPSLDPASVLCAAGNRDGGKKKKDEEKEEDFARRLEATPARLTS